MLSGIGMRIADTGGPHLLIGDCIERMCEIPDGSVDLTQTDIPYGEVNRASSGLRKLDNWYADISLTMA